LRAAEDIRGENGAAMHVLPATRDLVLVGGGHAHALVLLSWAMRPLPGVRLTLIDPEPVGPYTGMLPGLIAGHYGRAALEMDLVRLARHAGARLVAGRAEGLDAAAGKVRVPGRPPVCFDVVSLDIGITSAMPELPGFADHAAAVKPLGPFAGRWEAFVARIEAGRAPAEIAVIGAGVGGVEVALAMAHRLRHVPRRRITLIEREQAILPGFAGAGRLRRHLRAAGVDVLAGAEVAAIAADHVRLADGRCVPAALALGAAGGRPQSWLAETGLHLTDGYVTVGETLASVSHATVFAAGDCVHLVHAPRPNAGVFAVRAAPVLAHNLRAALAGTAPRRFRPQRDYLKLVSLGGQAAVADKWGIALEGAWLWRLKDRIDRRFMARFHRLPAMPAPAVPRLAAQGLADLLGAAPLCGGCGAKVGPGALRRALGELPAPADVLGAVGDDAAVLQIGATRQVIATDHLRAVTEDPWLMARIAAVHALGDVWAMGAVPQAALLSVILPRLSETLQERTLSEIVAGASEDISAAGAVIVGGHTTMGAELTIGFTVTGTCNEYLLTKAGARPGDALVLTKPLGSGTLLAAEMQKRAAARDIAALWPVLTQPQGAAAAILAPEAHAMTDVTGFGLAGHLDEMLRAGGVAADLELASVPFLPGAEALAAEGIASTIAPVNRAALIGRIAVPPGPRAALLFDPQTAGGLLAAVPSAAAGRLTAALNDAGYAAAVIGTVRAADGAPALRVG
jgi:selenide, water dikinase